jgi:hypothetical protein
MKILIAAFCIAGFILIFNYYKRRNEADDSDWGPDGRPFKEPPLSALGQAQVQLDSDIYKMLTTKETGFLETPICPRTKTYIKELVLELIDNQLKSRVNPSALMPIFGPEQQNEKMRQTYLDMLRPIMNEHGISDAWILKNGGYEAPPFHELHPATPLPSDFWETMPQGSFGDMLRLRWQAEEKYKNECFQGYHRHFGWPLLFNKLEDIPYYKIEIILKHKDQLLRKFIESGESTTIKDEPT